MPMILTRTRGTVFDRSRIYRDSDVGYMARAGICLLLAALLNLAQPTAAQQPDASVSTASDYSLETTFFKLPPGRSIGATSGLALYPDGDSIWVFDRCGANNCVGSDLDPVMGFDLEGNLLASFGRGMFVRPHGLYVDREGNIWATDDEGPNGTDPRRDGKGHQVFKFSPDGELLMTLGKPGVAGDGQDEFNRPSAVIVAPNGDIFVGDGHGPGSNARIVKFDSNGSFIKTWGQRGTEPGEFDVPHALAFDSQGRLFVGDRGNNRVQIFDQDGNFIDSWTQFGRPSGMFIDANDLLYVADSSSTPNNNPGLEEGVRAGSARDGRITIFLEDHDEDGSQEGVIADRNGNIYSSLTAGMALRKYSPERDHEWPTYGGHRHGDNLFANSILALDLHTGRRQWHFQTIHHDIWDWDLASAPILVDLNIEGVRRKALVQVTKQGLTFVFDKRTGEPLFEIEERPVPASDVPGERISPTQPFPVKPPPFGRHGISLDDLIDFTPELKAQAIEVASNYRLGPIYTPASLAEADDGTRGTIQLPRGNGGSNWPGGAVDPDTGILYIFYKSTPQVLSMAPSPRSDMNYVNLANRRTVPLIVDGLPLVKPPWGQISAIDMNEGEILWQVAHGETPDNVRDHPALQGMDIPRTGQPGFVGILVTKTLAIAGDGGTYTNEEGRTVAMLRAYDKFTGAELGAVELPGRASGSPMTYEIDGVQYLAVAVSGPNLPGRLMVFSYGD